MKKTRTLKDYLPKADFAIWFAKNLLTGKGCREGVWFSVVSDSYSVYPSFKQVVGPRIADRREAWTAEEEKGDGFRFTQAHVRIWRRAVIAAVRAAGRTYRAVD